MDDTLKTLKRWVTFAGGVLVRRTTGARGLDSGDSLAHRQSWGTRSPVCVTAQPTCSSSSRKVRQRSRRRNRPRQRRGEETKGVAAAGSMRPARNIVSRCRRIRARALRTVKRPKCGRQRRCRRRTGAAGAASCRAPNRSSNTIRRRSQAHKTSCRLAAAENPYCLPALMSSACMRTLHR
jgi:hypothetical protein